MTSGGASGGPDSGGELIGYGRALLLAASSLREPPYDELVATLRRAHRALAFSGPRLARDAAWLARREDYLIDATNAVAAGVERLDVALADPLEADLSVRAWGMRENVRYFADVVADVVPAPVYLDVGRDLLPMIEDTYGAPGLSLQLRPLVERVLAWLRDACGLAATLTARAEAVLAVPVPGEAAVHAPGGLLYDLHVTAIDRLIQGLRDSRSALLARPREDDLTYERAVRDGLEMTPRQLSASLAAFAT